MSLAGANGEHARTDDIRLCPKTIALAVSVVRSKPAELSVKDYIHLLRQHVAKGRRADAVSSKYRHLDRSSYWRSEYDRAKDALEKANKESVDLRLEIESLKDRLDAAGASTARPSTATVRPSTARPSTARPATATKKRKKQDEDTIPVPRSPKRVKRAASPTRFAPLEIAVEDDVSKAGDTGTILLRSVFDIHTTIKPFSKTDVTKLAYHVLQASSTASEIVKKDMEQCIAEESSSVERMTSTLTVAGRAVASMFVGLNKISHAPEGAAVQGKVVHAIVQMFKELLSELEWLASAEVEKAENEAAKAKKSTSKAKSKPKSSKPTNFKGAPTLGTLAAFLAGIINMLDAKLDANKAVFEGIAYCVIDRLGQGLFSTVFGHPRGSTLEAEILQSRTEDDIEDDEASSAQKKELVQKRVRMEAPYLIHLLTRIMAIAPAHLGAALTKAGKPKQANNKSNMKGALAITAKECLQSTLVNAMFGTEGMDENDPFMDCLKMPLPGNATIPMPKVKEQRVGEWFKGEIWNMLGWEILSRSEG